MQFLVGVLKTWTEFLSTPQNLGQNQGNEVTDSVRQSGYTETVSLFNFRETHFHTFESPEGN